jgi:hypothetical protein
MFLKKQDQKGSPMTPTAVYIPVFLEPNGEILIMSPIRFSYLGPIPVS